jgi:hypothetical protein
MPIQHIGSSFTRGSPPPHYGFLFLKVTRLAAFFLVGICSVSYVAISHFVEKQCSSRVFMFLIVLLPEHGADLEIALKPNLSEREFLHFLGQKRLGENSRGLTKRLFWAYQRNLLSSVFIQCKNLKGKVMKSTSQGGCSFSDLVLINECDIWLQLYLLYCRKITSNMPCMHERGRVPWRERRNSPRALTPLLSLPHTLIIYTHMH